MTWQIKYQYETGDSFSNRDAEGILEMEWDDLDIAKENLQRIREHYTQYSSSRYPNWRVTKKQLEEQQKEATAKPWFVKQYDFCLNLKADNGNECQISAPWCGYFERLYGAEIISKEPEDDDMRIEF
jgi:hypothetical protein